MIDNQTIDAAEAQNLRPIAIFLVDEEGTLFRKVDEDFVPTQKQAEAVARICLVLQVLQDIDEGRNPFLPEKSIITNIADDVANESVAKAVRKLIH